MHNDLVTIEVEGQHLEWCNELVNINDQLLNYEKILMEIKSPENKKEVEHFQNQFFIQKNIIAKLKNEIKLHDLSIQREKSEAFDEVPRTDLNYHENVGAKVVDQITICENLKKEFAVFIHST